VVSRSGTLTYQVVDYLTRAGIGQSTCIGIGGDPIIGTNFLDVLEGFEADAETDAVVMIGEIGGTDEQEAARFIKTSMKKPVVGFIAGRTAPAGKRMGHAGAIISGGSGTAQEKIEALAAAGVPVAPVPSEISDLLRRALD
jgi:succinyl-CoA synthetase alpha subunit